MIFNRFYKEHKQKKSKQKNEKSMNLNKVQHPQGPNHVSLRKSKTFHAPSVNNMMSSLFFFCLLLPDCRKHLGVLLLFRRWGLCAFCVVIGEIFGVEILILQHFISLDSYLYFFFYDKLLWFSCSFFPYYLTNFSCILPMYNRIIIPC